MRPPANCEPPTCPDCGAFLTKVVLTKKVVLKEKDEQDLIVRRRQCLICTHRFYTAQEMAPPEIPMDVNRISWINDGRDIVLKKPI